MLIAGLNAFHPDSSACVLKDGRLVAAVAEERLGARLKHVAGFPVPVKLLGYWVCYGVGPVLKR